MLSEEFGLEHLSVGDLLRKAVAYAETMDGEVVEHVRKGSLLPTEALFRILKPEFESRGQRTILLDGFPRRLDQAKAFEEKVSLTQEGLRYDRSSN